MFTQCPDCHTTFRVTAPVLQQAEGRVRCGGCGNPFNALEHLSEDENMKRESGTNTDAGSTTDQNKRLLETLEKLAGPDVTLEDTGVEWRVLTEADGVEGASDKPAMLRRREDMPRPVSDAQTTLDLPPAESDPSSSGERRYDDNTVLPDDFGSEDDLDELPFLSKPETPRRRADDRESVQDTAEFDDAQVDLALSEPDDWVDLLDEVADDQGPGVEGAAEVAAVESAAVQTAAGDDAEPATAADAAAQPPEEDMPSDIDTQFLQQAEEMGLDTGSHPIIDEDDAEDIDDYLASAAAEAEADETDTHQALDQGDEDAAKAGEDEAATAAAEEAEETELSLEEDEADAGAAAELESTGEFEAQIAEAERALAGEDEEEAVAEESGEPAELELEVDSRDAAAEKDSDTRDDTSSTIIGGHDVSKLFDEDSHLVETIIMEGDSIGDSLNERRRHPDVDPSVFENPGPLDDTYSLSRGKIRGGRRATDPAGFGVMAAVGVLFLLLLIQAMHQSRQSLATYGAFNHTIGSIYRVLGKPVTPEWDVRGWQFEATSNSVDEEQDLLTIYSRVANKSGQDLPYPLLHISLTDRWEDIIGSRVLEPGEYLAGDLDPRMPVPAGEEFNAVITIESPSAEATGFKLTVCYRVTQGRVRCATQDFKN